jgi:ribosomal subunit interface protein
MHLYLTARHFDLTDAIRQHVEEHLLRPIAAHVDRHELNRMEVQLWVGQRDARYGCHVMVQLPGHGHDLNVSEEGKDLYAAIDLAEKRVLRRLLDLRQRRLTEKRHPKKYSWDRVARVLRSAR